MDIKSAKMELVRVWRELESGTEQSLLPSQASKLQPVMESVELYGSEFSAKTVKENLKSSATVEFQELPDEEIPRKPSAKPARR